MTNLLIPVVEESGIVCEDLNFSWYRHPKPDEFIFRDFTIRVEKGEFVSFIGPSGCGKTTLLNMISGLCAPFSGKVRKDGLPVMGPDRDLGFVFQDYSLFPWLTVKGNVAFGLGLGEKPVGEREEITTRILRRVGLWEARNRYPYQLSGGMRQRTAIARVLANDAQYLLMDEPFGALDYQTRINMQNFLAEICDEFRKTVVFVTHHVEEAIILSDRIFLMQAGYNHQPDQLVIDLPRPRDITGKRFNDYRKTIIGHLNKENYYKPKTESNYDAGRSIEKV